MEQLSRPWSNSQREIYIKTPRPLSVRRAVFVNFIDLDPFLTSGLIRLHGLVLLPHLMKRSTHSILHLFSHLNGSPPLFHSMRSEEHTSELQSRGHLVC